MLCVHLKWRKSPRSELGLAHSFKFWMNFLKGQHFIIHIIAHFCNIYWRLSQKMPSDVMFSILIRLSTCHITYYLVYFTIIELLKNFTRSIECLILEFNPLFSPSQDILLFYYFITELMKNFSWFFLGLDLEFNPLIQSLIEPKNFAKVKKKSFYLIMKEKEN